MANILAKIGMDDVMVLFSRLFGNNIETSIAPRAINASQTPNNREGLYDTFKTVFFDVMSRFDGFTPEEVEEMFWLIPHDDQLVFSQSSYSGLIYENYFHNRKWEWPLYEKWRPILGLDSWADINNIYGKIKAEDLKKLLKRFNLAFDPRSLKDKLIQILVANTNFDEMKLKYPILHEIEIRLREKEKKSVFDELIQFMVGKADNLNKANKFSELGIKKYGYVYTGDLDHDKIRKFAETVLQEEPGSLPPFFPHDKTTIRLMV